MATQTQTQTADTTAQAATQTQTQTRDMLSVSLNIPASLLTQVFEFKRSDFYYQSELQNLDARHVGNFVLVRMYDHAENVGKADYKEHASDCVVYLLAIIPNVLADGTVTSVPVIIPFEERTGTLASEATVWHYDASIVRFLSRAGRQAKQQKAKQTRKIADASILFK